MKTGRGPVNSSKVAEAGIEPAQVSFRATCSYQQERLRRKTVAETTGDQAPHDRICGMPPSSEGGLPQIGEGGTIKAAREGIEPSAW